MKDGLMRGKRSACLPATRVDGFVGLVALPSAPPGTSERIGGGHVEGDLGRTKAFMCEGQGRLRLLGEVGQSEVWSEGKDGGAVV